MNVAEYVARCVGPLRLRDWKVSVSSDPPDDENSAADVQVINNRVRIRFGPYLYGATREEQREIVAHELVHVHVDKIDTSHEALLGCVSPEMQRSMQKVYIDGLEHATDILSHVVAPLLPLPPKNLQPIKKEGNPPSGGT